MANFTVYQGTFICHICRVHVKTARLYPETRLLTWMCKDKHLSSVKFGKQKRKSDDREE